MPGKSWPESFRPASRLKSDSIKSPTTAAALRMTPKNDRMHHRHAVAVRAAELQKHNAGQRRNHNRAAKTFPRFAGADARDHFVFADQRPDRISAAIAELRHENEIQDVVMPCRTAGEEIDLLDEVQQPRAHTSDRNSVVEMARTPGGVCLRKELAHAQARARKDHEKARFEIVDPSRRRVLAEVLCEIQKRPTISSSPPKIPHFCNTTGPVSPRSHKTQPSPAHVSNAMMSRKTMFGDELVARKQRAEHHRPKDHKARQPAQKNYSLGRPGFGCDVDSAIERRT